MEVKICTKCKIEKPLDQFYKQKPDKKRKCLTQSRCILCLRQDGKEKYYRRTEEYRNYRIKSKYGIDTSIYTDMLDAQHGVCAICGKPETRKTFAGKIQKLQIDHDHETGVIRGLLCNSCNSGIGYFRENPEIMKKAIAYLNQYSCPPVSRKNSA